VTAADVAKGAAAARFGGRLAGPAGANAAAVAAVVGHCFPPARSGGKGVATSIGQVLGTFPVYLPLDLAVGASTASLPRFRQRTRTAAAVASAVWVTAATVWWRRGLPNPGGVTPTVALPLGAIATSAVIAVRFAAGADDVAAYNSVESR
jgi:glycerol-3-phosphate acyltransferase PlsY